jgi:hypothetical protein
MGSGAEYDPRLASPGSYERLPCGCEIWDQRTAAGEPEFVMRPCAPSCEYYRYAVGESRRQGLPVVARDDAR